VIRVILDADGNVQAVEDAGRRGVTRGPVSLRRFVEAVNEEFPELRLEVYRGKS
jgi:hypothetical protein